MSVTPQVPGGNNATPGGQGDSPNEIDPTPSPSGAERMVKYETYQKLLDEKKRAAEKLHAYEAAEAQKKQEELLKNNQFKEALEMEQKKAKEAEDRLAQANALIMNSRKLNALVSSVKGTVDPKFYNLIDLSQIEVDVESGLPDPESVKRAAQALERDYPEIVKKVTPGVLPANAPASAGGKITREEWLKLPHKEMAKRLGDVIG